MRRKHPASPTGEVSQGRRREQPQSGEERPPEAWLDDPDHLRSFFEAIDRARNAKIRQRARRGGTPTR